MLTSNSLRWLVVVAGAAMLLAVAAACGTETVEVPGETVVVEKEVIKTVEVPGETVVKEVVKEVQVPGETVVVKEEVVKEVMVPGETVVVEKVVTETVEVPGETVTVEVVKEVQVPGETVVVEKEVIREVMVPGETVVVEKVVTQTVQVPGETVVVEKEVVKTVEVPGETVVVEKEVVKTVVVEKVVVATPAPGPGPSMMAPTGTLNIGFKELEPFSMSPRLTQAPIAQYGATASHENLVYITPEKKPAGKLAEEWSIDSTGTVWNFKLREGVQFHFGWGEATVDDVIWSLNDFVADGGINSLARGITKRIFFAEGGGTTKIDDYRFEVDTVVPQFDMLSFGTAVNALNYIVSKNQFEQEGEDVAKSSPAGTGPWEFAGQESGQNWSFDAVLDHYRKTPEFAKLVMWSIPEEATRVANFQLGRLDSFQMSFDSKPALDEMVDIRYMAVANGASEHLGLWGNWYVGMGESDYAERRPGAAKCLAEDSCPWVSSDPDPNSAEWERARKVREALSIAIDRDLIVETLLGGEGRAQSLWFWENQIPNLDPDLRTIEFNPERAKQLLEEAGYPDGFSITVTTSIRGVPAESEACDAISEMWEDIGIDTEVQRIPYAALGPQLGAREFYGANCHGTDGRLHPLDIMHVVLASTSGFSGGSDHPITDDLIEEARAQTNEEARWRVMNQLARFVYENVMETGPVHRQYPVASEPKGRVLGGAPGTRLPQVLWRLRVCKTQKQVSIFP